MQYIMIKLYITSQARPHKFSKKKMKKKGGYAIVRQTEIA